MSAAGGPEGFLGYYLEQQEAAKLEEAAGEEARPGEWRNLWTWIQRIDGEVLPASLENLGRAREIADELGTRSCAVVFGRGVTPAAQRLGDFGADRVYVLDAPEYADFELERACAALVQAIRDRRPEVLLLPATIQGRNLGAQVSMAVPTGIVPNCNALTLDPTQRILVGHQTSFRERLLSDVVCPTDRPQIFTVTPGSFRRPAPERGRRAQVVPLAPPPSLPTPRVRVRSLEPDPPKRVEQFDAIVVAGLGLASPEGFDLARALAEELQAYAGATRGAVACGWAGPERLITVVRHKLRPRLYVACGVVGEYDHLKAIEDADFVVALTGDANAPIAENADLVGLGEPAALLRRVVDHVRASKTEPLRIP